MVSVLQIGAATSTGKLHTENQDAFYCHPPGDTLSSAKGILMAVADGMGGHTGGATASKMAIDIIVNEYYNSINNVCYPEILKNAFVKANRLIFERSQADEDLAGMGTTLTAIVIKGDKFFFAHVGDSRGYLVDASGINQFTKDHTLADSLFEAGVITDKKAFQEGPDGNLLIKAIGLKKDVSVDVSDDHLPIEQYQRILLCCDGLYKVVSEPEIKEIVVRYRNPQKACERLIERANEYGGPDNITALVASMGKGAFMAGFFGRFFSHYAIFL